MASGTCFSRKVIAGIGVDAGICVGWEPVPSAVPAPPTSFTGYLITAILLTADGLPQQTLPTQVVTCGAGIALPGLPASYCRAIYQPLNQIASANGIADGSYFSAPKYKVVVQPQACQNPLKPVEAVSQNSVAVFDIAGVCTFVGLPYPPPPNPIFLRPPPPVRPVPRPSAIPPPPPGTTGRAYPPPPPPVTTGRTGTPRVIPVPRTCAKTVTTVGRGGKRSRRRRTLLTSPAEMVETPAAAIQLETGDTDDADDSAYESSIFGICNEPICCARCFNAEGACCSLASEPIINVGASPLRDSNDDDGSGEGDQSVIVTWTRIVPNIYTVAESPELEDEDGMQGEEAGVPDSDEFISSVSVLEMDSTSDAFELSNVAFLVSAYLENETVDAGTAPLPVARRVVYVDTAAIISQEKVEATMQEDDAPPGTLTVLETTNTKYSFRLDNLDAGNYTFTVNPLTCGGLGPTSAVSMPVRIPEDTTSFGVVEDDTDVEGTTTEDTYIEQLSKIDAVDALGGLIDGIQNVDVRAFSDGSGVCVSWMIYNDDDGTSSAHTPALESGDDGELSTTDTSTDDLEDPGTEAAGVVVYALSIEDFESAATYDVAPIADGGVVDLLELAKVYESDHLGQIPGVGYGDDIGAANFTFIGKTQYTSEPMTSRVFVPVPEGIAATSLLVAVQSIDAAGDVRSPLVFAVVHPDDLPLDDDQPC